MMPFTEALRYNYDLTADSLVLDVGAHKGDFVYGIYERYRCNVRCYEPLYEFYQRTQERFAGVRKITVLNYGLGSISRLAHFRVKGDMTGMFADDGPDKEVRIVSILDEMRTLTMPHVDLLKINIEGGEYELLDEILALGITGYFRDIQVQFHSCIPNAEERRNRIRDGLALTHRLTYDAPFIWENWRRIES